MNRHSIHHLVLPVVLAAFGASSATAQGLAASDIVRGCLEAGPHLSLRTPQVSPTAFRQDANGIFVFEAESSPLAGSWVAESSLSGYSGASYLRWNGRNQFNSPGTGILTYRLWCEQPGRYRLQMHNRHEHPDPSEENDCWMSMNGASWRKIYSNDNRNARVWNWHTRVDPGHGFYEFDLVEGLNELRVSGRSANFMLDRIHVFPRALGRVEDLRVPRSAVLRERPVLGRTVPLWMGDLRNEAGLPAGATNAYMMFSLVPSSSNCGIRLPGFGKNGGPGEYLLTTAVLPEVAPAGVWNGPNHTVSLGLQIPNRASLVGAVVQVQGLFVAPGGGSLQAVLTDRVDLTIGDH